MQIVYIVMTHTQIMMRFLDVPSGVCCDSFVALEDECDMCEPD